MENNNIRKVFLDDLPRDKRNRIKWILSIGHKIRFIYDNTEGWLEIISYDKESRCIVINYDGFTTVISTTNIINSKLSKIINNKLTEKCPNWLDEEIKILKDNYSHVSNECMKTLLPSRTIRAINTQAQRYKISKSDERLLESKLENINIVNKFKYREEGFSNLQDYIKFIHKDDKSYIRNLNESFIQYKLILNNSKSCFNNEVVTREGAVVLFKYYLIKNNINVTRNYLLNTNYTNLCMASKLDSYIQKHYSGYYDFICACYPKYNLKVWEFKILDCPNGYWSNKYNMYYCIRENIRELFENKVISTYSDIFKIPSQILCKYFHSSISVFYEGSIKQNIINYLDFIKVEYSIDKYYEGMLFDSFEEIEVYKHIKKIFPSVVKNKSTRFYNEKYKEGYIPDFIFGDVIIEYFGMYKLNSDNKMYKEYSEKTQRKIKYFDSISKYKFIAIFPKDLYGNNIENKLLFGRW